MSAEQRRKDMKLLSAFLFVSCIYVLNAHGIGKTFQVQLQFAFHDSLYLNITPLETLLVDDKFDCSFACVHNKTLYFLQLGRDVNRKTLVRASSI